MSFFRADDFSNDFHNDFNRNDSDFIIDRLNGSMQSLIRDYGEPFLFLADEINRDNKLPQTIADNIAALLYETVIKGRNSLDNNLNDVIDAVLLTTAKNVMDANTSLGNDRTYDFLKNTLSRNPLLQPARGGGRDYNTRERGGPRGNERSNDRGGSSRYSQNDQQRRGSVPAGGGRLVPEKDRQKAQQSTREQNSEVRVVQPQVNNGDIITSDNRMLTGIEFCPAYIVGDEQTIYMDEKLQVIDYTGTTPVDYDKHRVDLFFPNIIGASALAATNSLTETALRRAEEAMDLKISGYLKDPNNPEAEEVLDSKLFQTVKSMTYELVQNTVTLQLDAVDIRDSIVDGHGASSEWFRDNAMIVNVNQFIDFGDSNDAFLNVSALSKQTNYLEVVKWLIGLSKYIDASRWKFIHDHLTRNLNIIMLRQARLGVKVSSITGDWNELREFLEKTEQSKRTLMQANFGKLSENLEVLRDETDNQNLLKVKHTLVYLPLTSYECELASASVKTGIVTVAKDTKLYGLVSRLYENDPYGELSFVTLDGLRFGLLLTEEITNREFDIILF